MNSSKLSYRAEIDGLRAIAVVSVILYHAQIVVFGRDWFEGGFIGVDIFFVISGYLITRIILSELELKGSFSFLNFYERRARRILPMLFVIVFFTLFMGWWFLLPADYSFLAESAISTLTFWSNFFFYFEQIEYDAVISALKPLLHTWSLSVEEQFYIAFPLVAIIAFKYFRNHFLTILIGLSLLSLQFSELMEARDSDLNFYLPFSRFWELAVGSMLAYRELYYKPSYEGLASKSLPIFGLYLVGYSILLFDGKTPHPSFHTLIPIIGVALIIGFASKDELVGKILGSQPFVWIGLISYSAYLWHYPIMSFSRILLERIDIYIQIQWIFYTFILSIISYHLIEKPFRNNSKIPSKILVFSVLSLFSAVFLFSYFVVINDGFKDRVPNAVLRESFDDRFANIDIFDRCHRRKGDNPIPKLEFCDLGNTKDKKVYLIGDSHMVSIAFELVSYLKEQNTNLVLMTRGGSLFGKKHEIDIARLDVLEKVSDSVIIFGGFAHREREEFFSKNRELYENIFESLSARNNSIVLIYPFPSTDIKRRRMALDFLIFGELPQRVSSLNKFHTQAKAAYSFYDSLNANKIYRIYPKEFLCDAEYCFGIRNQEVLISDDDHPSRITAGWVIDKMKSEGVFD